MNASPNKGGRPRKVIKPFPPLEQVTSPTVDTDAAAYYLNRRPQTLRGWACAESWPDGLRPLRINGRLCWPVAGLRAALAAALGLEGRAIRPCWCMACLRRTARVRGC